jgi:DNA mismatch endonuclease (patch repair protein)
MDIFTAARRSEIMRAIKSKDTAPELKVKRALWGSGLRYGRSHANLPGRPDIVFPHLKAVVFINGCFWHGHTCSKARLPKSNIDFWRIKIETNKRRDRRVIKQLRRGGWSCFTIWQCTLGRGTARVAASLSRRRRSLIERL